MALRPTGSNKAATKAESAILARVRKERDELQAKLSKLCAFMDTRFEECKFLQLSPANRILLERQKAVMQEYRDILDTRIELMEGK